MSIERGNDEFILYIRKVYHNCLTANDTLGRLIWKQLKELDPEALIIEKDKPCFWEHIGDSVSEIRLPKTAAQFRFNRVILPRLYDYLDQLG